MINLTCQKKNVSQEKQFSPLFSPFTTHQILCISIKLPYIRCIPFFRVNGGRYTRYVSLKMCYNCKFILRVSSFLELVKNSGQQKLKQNVLIHKLIYVIGELTIYSKWYGLVEPCSRTALLK